MFVVFCSDRLDVGVGVSYVDDAGVVDNVEPAAGVWWGLRGRLARISAQEDRRNPSHVLLDAMVEASNH
jgi:hypothetical protein